MGGGERDKGERGEVVVAVNTLMEPLRLLRKWYVGNQ